MYHKSARIYDAIYASHGKDYEAEAEKLHNLIQQYKKSPGITLLDVACGTGNHVAQLQIYIGLKA
jgi:ubiquinone/menaquinone biosynthesis C-methylase UbiE